jgi:hypothetical protein
MPTPYMNELHKQGHGSIEHLEKKWAEAKDKAAGEGHADNYALITDIFKKMVHASTKDAYTDAELSIHARLLTSEQR